MDTRHLRVKGGFPLKVKLVWTGTEWQIMENFLRTRTRNFLKLISIFFVDQYLVLLLRNRV